MYSILKFIYINIYIVLYKIIVNLLIGDSFPQVSTTQIEQELNRRSVALDSDIQVSCTMTQQEIFVSDQ